VTRPSRLRNTKLLPAPCRERLQSRLKGASPLCREECGREGEHKGWGGFIGGSGRDETTRRAHPSRYAGSATRTVLCSLAVSLIDQMRMRSLTPFPVGASGANVEVPDWLVTATRRLSSPESPRTTMDKTRLGTFPARYIEGEETGGLRAWRAAVRGPICERPAASVLSGAGTSPWRLIVGAHTVTHVPRRCGALQGDDPPEFWAEAV